MYKLSNTSKKRLEGVDSRIHQIIDLALTLSKVDFGIPEYGGVRTEIEQHKLFLKGKGVTEKDGKYKRSVHQDGRAFDVFAYVEGKATWDTVYMAQVACAILQAANMLGYKLKWGGLWISIVDMPHFELAD